MRILKFWSDKKICWKSLWITILTSSMNILQHLIVIYLKLPCGNSTVHNLQCREMTHLFNSYITMSWNCCSWSSESISMKNFFSLFSGVYSTKLKKKKKPWWFRILHRVTENISYLVVKHKTFYVKYPHNLQEWGRIYWPCKNNSYVYFACMTTFLMCGYLNSCYLEI